MAPRHRGWVVAIMIPFGSDILGVPWTRFAIDLVFLCGMTWLLCASAPTIAGVLGVVYHPDGRRKKHASPTPLIGGLAIVAPFVVYCVTLAMDDPGNRLFAALAVTASAYFALGLADDQHDVKPKYRLALATIIALVVINIAPDDFQVDALKFSVSSLSFGLYPFSLVFTTLCLIGLVNAMNMADGVNGLALGMCLIWTLLLSVYGPAELTPLLVAFAAALGITLVYNLRGKLFLGDSGTYAISMVVAVLTIYCYSHTPTTLRADTVALWFLVPVLDCLRLMVWRVASGRSPFSADKHHLHHFLRRWMSPIWVVASYLALIAVPCLLALAWPGWTLAWAGAVVLAYAVIVLRATRPVLRRWLRSPQRPLL
jgi:UDP-GlcNAc:undecaprenyl-phosphate GlcNAc-1-phosphate transferase